MFVPNFKLCRQICIFEKKISLPQHALEIDGNSKIAENTK